MVANVSVATPSSDCLASTSLVGDEILTSNPESPAERHSGMFVSSMSNRREDTTSPSAEKTVNV